MPWTPAQRRSFPASRWPTPCGWPSNFPPRDVVLGGEREGLPIEGFPLGNSPEEYTRRRVGGKTLLFTTTNGTRAMIHARQADEVLVAAFVNVQAVLGRLFDRQRVHIVCAGTDGKIGHDDVLLAGMLVERLQREGGMVYHQNAQAITARELWLNSFALPQALGAEPLEPERLAVELGKSLGRPAPGGFGPGARRSGRRTTGPLRHCAAA